MSFFTCVNLQRNAGGNSQQSCGNRIIMAFPHIFKRVNSVNQNSKGFTLMEMIVVMAIVLMLALLVYSVTVKAIKKGEGIQCISQMRQLGIGLSMYLQDYGRYPDAVRYAPHNEKGSIIDCLADYIDNTKVFVCPSCDESFKQAGLSYIYNTEAKANTTTNQWLLVDARLPGSPNPHLGDRATVLWSDGHAEVEEVVLPE